MTPGIDIGLTLRTQEGEAGPGTGIPHIMLQEDGAQMQEEGGATMTEENT